MTRVSAEVLEGAGLRLRRARFADAAFLAALATDPAVEPFISAMAPREPSELRRAIERSLDEPAEQGRFLIEVGGNRPAGALAFELVHRRSRSAHLFGVAVTPELQGRGLGAAASRLMAEHLIRDLGYHRVQLECYGFNQRAVHMFERAGFVREGVKRKAYWRHGGWADGVLLALIEDDLGAPPGP
jgi:RimJ/RimL family protein N-acetyltransferase